LSFRTARSAVVVVQRRQLRPVRHLAGAEHRRGHREERLLHHRPQRGGGRERFRRRLDPAPQFVFRIRPRLHPASRERRAAFAERPPAVHGGQGRAKALAMEEDVRPLARLVERRLVPRRAQGRAGGTDQRAGPRELVQLAGVQRPSEGPQRRRIRHDQPEGGKPPRQQRRARRPDAGAAVRLQQHLRRAGQQRLERLAERLDLLREGGLRGRRAAGFLAPRRAQAFHPAILPHEVRVVYLAQVMVVRGGPEDGDEAELRPEARRPFAGQLDRRQRLEERIQRPAEQPRLLARDDRQRLRPRQRARVLPRLRRQALGRARPGQPRGQLRPRVRCPL
jgi:hypothetical protein